MKIVCISDTHRMHAELKIPECDVLIHCGDFSGWGELQSVDDIAYWFDHLKDVGEILLVAGNHDVNFLNRPEQSKFIIKKSCHYLDNKEVVIDGIKFYGMTFLDIIRKSVFETICDRIDDRKKVYDDIPEDTDVLVTHHPPDIPELSETEDGFNLGCPFLMDAVQRIKPKIHVFGHVHSSYGIKQVDQTTFINASSMHWTGNTLNKPIVVEI